MPTWEIPYTAPAQGLKPAGCWRQWTIRKIGMCWCYGTPGHEGDHFCSCGQKISEADWKELYGV